MPRYSTEDLKHREYLTPNEAARVFGRTDDFYRGLYREKRIAGYTHTVHRATLSMSMLYLKTESIRAYFDSLCAPVVEHPAKPPRMIEILRKRGLVS